MHLKRVGVIVNEWGDLGVDKNLLKSTGVQHLYELLGGQLFCSCLSGSFLLDIESLLSLKVTTIFIETSGLAKPSTLRDVIVEALKRFEGRVLYQGMVCVVDAQRFLSLRSVVKALDEQVAYADHFIVTEADRVDPETVQRIIQVLRELKPNAEIITRAGNPIPFRSVFKIGTPVEVIPQPYDPCWDGWGEGGRPRKITIVPKEQVTQNGLKRFLEEIAPHTLRIKGLVPLREGMRLVQVDGIGEEAHLLPWVGAQIPVQPEGIGITFVWIGPTLSQERVLQSWKIHTGTEAEMV